MFADHGTQGKAIDVVDLSGTERLTRLHDLVPRRKDRNSRTREHVDLGESERCDRADAARRQEVAHLQNDLACRYGYEGAAAEIQELYLAGNRQAAIAAIPDALVDDVALCGPKARIKERLELWRNSPVNTLNIMTFDLEGLRVMAELVL